jgi:hypothetical protein
MMTTYQEIRKEPGGRELELSEDLSGHLVTLNRRLHEQMYVCMYVCMWRWLQSEFGNNTRMIFK